MCYICGMGFCRHGQQYASNGIGFETWGARFLPYICALSASIPQTLAARFFLVSKCVARTFGNFPGNRNSRGPAEHTRVRAHSTLRSLPLRRRALSLARFVVGSHCPERAFVTWSAWFPVFVSPLHQGKEPTSLPRDCVGVGQGRGEEYAVFSPSKRETLASQPVGKRKKKRPHVFLTAVLKTDSPPPFPFPRALRSFSVSLSPYMCTGQAIERSRVGPPRGAGRQERGARKTVATGARSTPTRAAGRRPTARDTGEHITCCVCHTHRRRLFGGCVCVFKPPFLSLELWTTRCCVVEGEGEQPRKRAS